MSEMHQRAKSAVSTTQAILDAYDRKILDISADYLADTLRMLLAAIDPLVNPAVTS